MTQFIFAFLITIYSFSALALVKNCPTEKGTTLNTLRSARYYMRVVLNRHAPIDMTTKQAQIYRHVKDGLELVVWIESSRVAIIEKGETVYVKPWYDNGNPYSFQYWGNHSISKIEFRDRDTRDYPLEKRLVIREGISGLYRRDLLEKLKEDHYKHYIDVQEFTLECSLDPFP